MRFYIQVKFLLITMLLSLLQFVVLKAEPKVLQGKTIVSWGSSVCDGWGASDRGWMWQLEGALSHLGANILHRSTPGHKTEDKETQIEREKILGADFVIVCLSLGNQGLDQAVNESQAYEIAQWYLEDIFFDEDPFDGDPESMVEYIRSIGAVPIVALAYPKANYSSLQCRQLVDANIYQQTLGVPMINHFSATNAGNQFNASDCRWAHGEQGTLNAESDLSHPNQLGHDEMFYAIPLDLFGAIVAGKEAPRRLQVSKAYQHVLSSRRLIYKPNYAMHNFSVQMDVKLGSEGVLFSVEALGGRSIDVQYTSGRLLVKDDSGDLILPIGLPFQLDHWHNVAITYSYVRQQLELYLDGSLVAFATAKEWPRLKQFFPYRFIIGGGRDQSRQLEGSYFRQLTIHRAALHAKEVQLQSQSSWLATASLDIYSPLQREVPLLNHAQTLQAIELAAYEPSNPLGRKLYLRGTSNDWQAVDHMNYQGDGLYSVLVYLDEGLHEFKIADQLWQSDTNFGSPEPGRLFSEEGWFGLMTPSQHNILINIEASETYHFEFLYDFKQPTSSSLRFISGQAPQSGL